MTRPLFEARGLTKSYGPNRILTDVNFSLARGESVALIGENGAGKSTFAKVITGVTRPDNGVLSFDGAEVIFTAPRDALAAGLAFIPQELAYVPDLSVAENIVLGQWPGRSGRTTPAAIHARAQAVCDRYGIHFDLDAPMRQLKLAERQLVEIVKALMREARMIVLDEPTAALNEQESAALFAILRRLNDQGVGVLYISHRMDEVYRFSDRVDVLRNGRCVASVRPKETTPTQLIAHMLGQEKQNFTRGDTARTGTAALQLRNWRSSGLPALDDVNLEVQAGEIVGLYGVRGSGADAIAEGLAGVNRAISGEIVIGGVTRGPFASPYEAKTAGLAYVPAERKRDGLVLGLPIRRNVTLMVLRSLSRFGFVDGAAERAISDDLVSRFNIRFRGADQPVERLSGGNQQKVLLASRIAAKPRYLVLHEPTRGVDVGARVEIHRLLAGAADGGCATLMITSDVEEAVTVPDRLIVIRDGRIAGELSGNAMTQANAISLATED
jgi:ABC-type sugar transport system ATPase subunit